MSQADVTQTSVTRIAVASFAGTAIEFFDFYVYATAAALVIGPVFFPDSSPAAQTLSAFVTFGIAFIARPIGSFLFGHFGDRNGRKRTLVASLLVMGVSTVLIGLLPGYGTIGVAAPILLCVLRFAQGIGLGGEWGGAALLATENAPPGKRGRFGMFPQLGPSIGFFAANGLFLILSLVLSDDQFAAWGWRIPFLASAVLVGIGLYVRLKLTETPVFTRAMQRSERSKVPLVDVLRHHLPALVAGSLSIVVCYGLFYIATVFCLSYGTTNLGYSKTEFLALLCVAVVFMALATPLTSIASDRFGRKPVLIVGCVLAIGVGFLLDPLLGSGNAVLVTVFLAAALLLMGATYGPMGAFLPELFPTSVRYTSASASYNIGGILGASLAPFVAAQLADSGGLAAVGIYLSVMAAVSLVAILLCRETKDRDLDAIGDRGQATAAAPGVLPG